MYKKCKLKYSFSPIRLTQIKILVAPAGGAQWIERGPVNQGVTGLIPSQGTCLGCRPGPQMGMCERQPHIDVSLPLCPSLPPL